MIRDSKSSEEQAVMNAAYAACAAVRTAPKACGVDNLETVVVTGEDKDRITAEMRRLGEKNNAPFFLRDAGNVDKSQAVILAGVSEDRRGLNELCGLCHFEDCKACGEANGCCIHNYLDLGIALGSAVSLLADRRIDTRIMFTIGQAAASLGMIPGHPVIMGIPLSVSGKSPFFDRG